ncbi:MAG: alkene reductase [Bacteroidota bacterium]
MSTLFESFLLGDITLKNRVVMAPLTRSRSTQDHVPTEIMATYYGQRAGAGLIITEGTSPSPNGVGYPRIPGIYNEEQIKEWKAVTDKVHAEGGKIFLQIMHTGRVTHPLNLPEGGKVLAPSPIAPPNTKMYTDQEGEKEIPTPHEMTSEDIAHTKLEYVTAAKNAIAAGFDGVELHAANGYLLEQFLNPTTNQRSDNYGVTDENRARFVLEVAKAVVAEIGRDKTGMRISPLGVFNDMMPFDGIQELYTYLSTELKEIGLAYLHIVDHSSMGAPEVPQDLKKAIRDAFGGTIIISGGYDKERANKDLEAGLVHLVAFGRPFISNPDLVDRMKNDIELAEPNPDLFYTPGAEGYTDYPTAS